MASGPVTLPVRLVAELPMAWRHFCGYLNEGNHQPDSVCGGCNSDAKPDQVDARYLLVELQA